MNKIDGRIYCVTNTKNGKRYVGKTTLTLHERWKRHCRLSDCPVLHKAIKKYGPENFSIVAIDTASTEEELNVLERLWIARLGTVAPAGYNLLAGGQGGPHHAATRRKLSADKRAFWSDQDNRRRMLAIMVRPDVMTRRNATRAANWTSERSRAFSEAQRLRHTPETRAEVGRKSKEAWARPGMTEKVSATLRRVMNTPEARAQLSALRRKQWADPAFRERWAAAMNAVVQSPEYRAKMSVAIKAKCADPEWLRRRTEAIVAAKRRKRESAASA